MEAQYNARNPAVKRLFREAQELAENPDEDFHAAPLEDNLFEWHFTIRGPADTPFENGLYHGRIILPTEYPMKPPNIIILTPNGRFETSTKICLSISGYHPETWQPSWSIRTALKALIGFMPTPASGAIGSLELPEARRRELAQTSQNWACSECAKTNHAIFAANASAGLAALVRSNSITTGAAGGDTSVPSPGSPTPISDTSAMRRSPDSASGGGDSEDSSFSTPQPIRPRTSSLQSKPGRGVGKRAHFEDEVPSPSPPVSTASTLETAYSFPPPNGHVESPSTSTGPYCPPESPPPLQTPSPTPNETTPSESTESMRSRQSAILVQRRRLLQERLVAATSAAAAQPASPTSPVMSSADVTRLERAVAMLRQVVFLIVFCVTFLILRRIVMLMDEDDLEEL